MSVSKAAESDSRNGVALIKAEYVFMYLNCRNYNRFTLHSFISSHSLIHHWYPSSSIYVSRLYCSVYPFFRIMCNIRNIV
jgi:hypothetical protein